MTAFLDAPTTSVPLQVLFVDDEIRILDGMRRALHSVCERLVRVLQLSNAGVVNAREG